MKALFRNSKIDKWYKDKLDYSHRNTNALLVGDANGCTNTTAIFSHYPVCVYFAQRFTSCLRLYHTSCYTYVISPGFHKGQIIYVPGQIRIFSCTVYIICPSPPCMLKISLLLSCWYGYLAVSVCAATFFCLFNVFVSKRAF